MRLRADDNDGMRRELKLAQQYDRERDVMDSYNETVRIVAEEMNVPLVDLAATFPVRPRHRAGGSLDGAGGAVGTLTLARA